MTRTTLKFALNFLRLLLTFALAGGSALPARADWPMAGANPGRTSWVAEDVPTVRTLAWNRSPNPSKPPYIPSKAQIIAAGDYIYVSASDGIHAMRYDSGADAGFYPMSMPPGHSPTVVNGVLYVGGYDKKVHAVSAAGGLAGAPLWTFQGQAGFDNNPLVVDGRLYIGGRDGIFYCLDALSGALVWTYNVGRPLSYSPAYRKDVQGQVWLYFADLDGFAYALDGNGGLRWKSARMPGLGFWSYWPVVHGNRVIFAGSSYYSIVVSRYGQFLRFEQDEAWPGGTGWGDYIPLGTAVAGSPNTWDCTYARNYLLAKPHRRTLFVLNAATGAEEEVGPFLWNGNEGAETRHPPMIGGDDGLLHFYGNFLSDPAIPWAHVLAWDSAAPARLKTFGSSLRSSGAPSEASDKPGALSGGGTKGYLHSNRGNNLWVFDRAQPTVAARRISLPKPGDAAAVRFMYGMPPPSEDSHGLANAPVPFRGRVYVHANGHVYCYVP